MYYLVKNKLHYKGGEAVTMFEAEDGGGLY